MNQKLLRVILLVVVSLTAQAKQYEGLTQFVSEQTKELSQTINQSLSEESLETVGEFFGQAVFRRFFIRVQAKVALDIEVVNLELIPELELVFQKDKVVPLAGSWVVEPMGPNE